jgi:hypothetical protein
LVVLISNWEALPGAIRSGILATIRAAIRGQP